MIVTFSALIAAQTDCPAVAPTGPDACSFRSPIASTVMASRCFDDASLKDVLDAEKACNESVPGSGENECRRSVLNDGAFSQYRDSIAEHHGVGVIVRDKDCRQRERAQKRKQFPAQLISGLRVEGREGFVEQEEIGPACKRTGKRHTLLFAGT